MNLKVRKGLELGEQPAKVLSIKGRLRETRTIAPHNEK
jgi:hypothetical protein